MTVHVPDNLAGGTYADGARIKYTGAGHMILDFVVRSEQHPGDYLAVSRIRLDVTAVQRLLGVLSERLTDYEREFGPRLGPDADGPSDEAPTGASPDSTDPT